MIAVGEGFEPPRSS